MPKVNGKEYPYTKEGMAAAKKAVEKMKDMNKKKPQGGTTGKPKKKPTPPKPQPKLKPGAGRYPGPGYDEQGPGTPRSSRTRIPGAATSKVMPSKAMNKAIPGNKGIDLSSAAKKFVMTMPPVMAARGAMAAGKAINDRINPPTRQMKRKSTGTVGDMLRKPGRPAPTPLPRKATPSPLDQLRKMNEMPKRKPKTLLPKKSGR